MLDQPPTVREEIRQTKPFRSAAEEAAVALLLTTERLRNHLSDAAEPEGLTLQQYNVLRILRGSHPEPLQTLELGSRMLERTPGITRLLDRLESKRLVRRERCAEDRRCVHCRITSAGLTLLDRLDRPMRQAAAAGFRGLDRSAITDLVARLDHVRAALRAASVSAERE
jgi:DNA-binding MarR family transcriptional regulator